MQYPYWIRECIIFLPFSLIPICRICFQHAYKLLLVRMKNSIAQVHRMNGIIYDNKAVMVCFRILQCCTMHASTAPTSACFYRHLQTADPMLFLRITGNWVMNETLASLAQRLVPTVIYNLLNLSCRTCRTTSNVVSSDEAPITMWQSQCNATLYKGQEARTCLYSRNIRKPNHPFPFPTQCERRVYAHNCHVAAICLRLTIFICMVYARFTSSNEASASLSLPISCALYMDMSKTSS